MSQKEWEHQMGLFDTHIAKANQCIEYGKLEDAEVHLMIARVLREGLSARFNHEKDSLLNLAQALTN